MNTKSKSIILVMVTLIFGFLLGAFTMATYSRSHRFADRVKAFRTPEGFVKRFEKIIQPEPAQSDSLRQILTRHFNQMHKISTDFRKRFETENDSLQNELRPYLTDEQLKRLNDELHRRRIFHQSKDKPEKEQNIN